MLSGTLAQSGSITVISWPLMSSVGLGAPVAGSAVGVSPGSTDAVTGGVLGAAVAGDALGTAVVSVDAGATLCRGEADADVGGVVAGVEPAQPASTSAIASPGTLVDL